MKLSLLILGLFAPLAFALAPSVSSRQASDAELPEVQAPLKLDESMGELNRGLRQLRSVLKDAAAMRAKVNDVAALERLVLEAKEILPEKVAALEDEASKASEIAAYRTEMNTALRGLLDVEDAFLAGDGEAAKAALQQLEKHKRSAHDRFQQRGQ
ncbi:MAG: cytochrome b562 [Planctomycetota bacterium]